MLASLMKLKWLIYSVNPKGSKLLQMKPPMSKKKTSKFRSKLEERVAILLEELGVTYEYESTRVPYTIQHHYYPDFVLPNYTYLETKGYWDAADRRKILAVKKDNPDIDIRMIFQAPFNTISKRSKTTYAQWCERHDIPWCAFHTIPLDWLI